ncbi:MAG: hypothetical protein ACD_79C01078G0005 [uncultured bacterium]|nr:MAG: hypothetical protein ACD_79C01078G0005 [uncultured bacterium]
MITISIIIIILFMFIGAPLFIIISASTLVAFNQNDFFNPSIFLEILRLADSPTLIAIPLFTFAGFILSASNAPTRIVDLSNAFLGWLPGGLAIVAVISCALLTAFTGASGVTIIALGSLLLPTLLKRGYNMNFSCGLLTTSGSRGLLFPPSLPLILYAVITKNNIDQLFKACLIPGLLGIFALIGYSIYCGRKIPVNDYDFSSENLFKILLKSWHEIPLPFIVIGGIYSGLFGVTEAACVAVLYCLIVEVLILKEIDFKRQLPKIMNDSMVLVGSILIILGCALAFTSFLVDNQIPMKILDWMKTYISSKIVFLLILNIFLLIVGCMMDIFSAIIIVVPLIYPIATELGINPFHLGVIFLTNLEIGYSTPPVGLNLFIATKTFNKPIIDIYKSTIPFLIIMLFILILVTFFPVLSTILI